MTDSILSSELPRSKREYCQNCSLVMVECGPSVAAQSFEQLTPDFASLTVLRFICLMSLSSCINQSINKFLRWPK